MFFTVFGDSVSKSFPTMVPCVVTMVMYKPGSRTGLAGAAAGEGVSCAHAKTVSSAHAVAGKMDLTLILKAYTDSVPSC
jgi:hypothetical protein